MLESRSMLKFRQNFISHFKKALRKREKIMNRKLLYTKEIQLSTDVYDSSRSSIKFTVTPVHPDIWTVHRDMQLTFVSVVNVEKAMH